MDIDQIKAVINHSGDNAADEPCAGETADENQYEDGLGGVVHIVFNFFKNGFHLGAIGDADSCGHECAEHEDDLVGSAQGIIAEDVANVEPEQ